MRKKKPTRGGVRKGAGRPVTDPSGARHKKTVWLSPAELAHCERLGGVTEAVRMLLAVSMGRKK